MPKEKISLEQQYLNLEASGPQEFLKEGGADGKRLARCAFDGTFQPHGPFDASTDDALYSAVRALLEHAKAALVEKFKSAESALLVQTARYAARGLHTHSGKYAQAESVTKFIEPADQHSLPYLSASSAAGMRSVTAGFAHAPKYAGAAKLFIANLALDDKVMSVAQLIAQGNRTVRQAFTDEGLSSNEWAVLRNLFAQTLQNEEAELDANLPQLLWPTPEGDVALTPLPALSVYNSIAAMRANVGADAYLRRGTFLVGSGQAQNISVAASSVAGNFPVLHCLPPRIHGGDLQRLIRQAFTGSLARKLDKDQQDKFFVSIHAWPNEARKKFLKYAAARHAALVLEAALELREAVLDEIVQAAALPDRDDPLTRFARGEPAEGELATLLVPVVFNALDQEKKELHTPADWSYYRQQLQAKVEALGHAI